MAGVDFDQNVSTYFFKKKKRLNKLNIQVKETIEYIVLFVKTYANARLLFTNPAEIS